MYLHFPFLSLAVAQLLHLKKERKKKGFVVFARCVIFLLICSHCWRISCRIIFVLL